MTWKVGCCFYQTGYNYLTCKFSYGVVLITKPTMKYHMIQNGEINSLTRVTLLTWVTRTEFLLTISIYHCAKKQYIFTPVFKNVTNLRCINYQIYTPFYFSLKRETFWPENKRYIYLIYIFNVATFLVYKHLN